METPLGLALIPVASARDLEEQQRKETAEQQARPLIQGLAAHVRKRWEMMRDYKRKSIEGRLKKCSRMRSLEYPPEKLAEIRKFGGSEIYMGVASTKCRTATAWMRDTLLGTGTDKPWALDATPVPELPPGVVEYLKGIMARQLQVEYANGLTPLDPAALKMLAAQMKDTAMRSLKEEAERRVDRMEQRIEDQLAEGGFHKALHQFLDDLATYPFAVFKGPVPRKRTTLTWSGGQLVPTETIRDEWERVDPYKFYWAPWGDDIQDIPCIELHTLTREDLEAMLGVEGYNDTAVRQVLADFGAGGVNWVEGDALVQDEVTGQDIDEAANDVVFALQLWDSIPGKTLVEWGMAESDVQDQTLTYPCEVWMVKNIVIKAVLNYDLLGRKPYYLTSFEKVPGRIDGNGVCDLAEDANNMCNAAARAVSNNMGISSGPQVGVNVARLPPGESIDQMYPWKLWQFVNPEYGDSSAPITFFQPQSNAAELMAVFEKFLSLADEVTGIPRYMTGEHVPGAGRTSSGLSMLISNAGKSIKQVIGNIDNDIISPMLERQYQRNIQYFAQDMDLIGDVQVVARGAMSLVVKESEAVRRAEFLRIVLESPLAQQIVGIPGAAELLRDQASNLNMNVDKLVPSGEEIRKQMMLMQQQSVNQEQPPAMQEDGSPQGGRQSNFISARPNGV